MTDAAFTADEVRALPGGYKRAADQLRELHKLGFYRARLGQVSRIVILDRAHDDAVCGGAGAANQDAYRPQVKPPILRARKR